MVGIMTTLCDIQYKLLLLSGIRPYYAWQATHQGLRVLHSMLLMMILQLVAQDWLKSNVQNAEQKQSWPVMMTMPGLRWTANVTTSAVTTSAVHTYIPKTNDQLIYVIPSAP